MRDLRTEGQRAREERDANIVSAYTAIRREQPLVTRNRVLCTVAADYGLVTQTVKMILRKHDAYI